MTDRLTLLDRYRDLEARSADGRLMLHDHRANTPISSEWQMANATREVDQAVLDDFSRQLDAVEKTIKESEAKQERWDSQDAARAESARPLGPDDPEYQQVRQIQQEAAQQAAYRRSTEGRLEAVELVLERIAGLLERRA